MVPLGRIQAVPSFLRRLLVIDKGGRGLAIIDTNIIEVQHIFLLKTISALWLLRPLLCSDAAVRYGENPLAAVSCGDRLFAKNV
jgi:hypothetical protein